MLVIFTLWFKVKDYASALLLTVSHIEGTLFALFNLGRFPGLPQPDAHLDLI